MADWSSLPLDLLRCIADCLLSTNDLDRYMDFRAVCPSWRSATDDPTGSSDLRFRPHHWIIIDEVLQSERSRLLVNTATGRVLRKDLPLLRRFCVVATTHGGLIVLADKEPPHAARVLNPFTGHTIVFSASVPFKADISAAALGGAPFPTLALLSDRCRRLYTAAPESKAFVGGDNKCRYVFMRQLVAAGARADGEETLVLPPTPGALPKEMFALMKVFDIDPAIGLADYAFREHRCLMSSFLVKSGTQLLAVVMEQSQLKVFNLSTGGDEPEPVKSIGDRAIFIGYSRCLCVSAGKFPSVVANCIYHVKYTKSSWNIYRYDLEAGKEEMVSEAVDSLNPAKSSFPNFPLITVVQLLSSYTINVRDPQIPKKKLHCLPTLL